MAICTHECRARASWARAASASPRSDRPPSSTSRPAHARHVQKAAGMDEKRRARSRVKGTFVRGLGASERVGASLRTISLIVKCGRVKVRQPALSRARTLARARAHVCPTQCGVDASFTCTEKDFEARSDPSLIDSSNDEDACGRNDGE
eukprot:5520377-Pleurochrysis_carterae.AAC.1